MHMVTADWEAIKIVEVSNIFILFRSYLRLPYLILKEAEYKKKKQRTIEWHL